VKSVSPSYLYSEWMLHHEREHLRVWHEFCEREAVVLDRVTEEHGKVAVQGEVERGSLVVQLKESYFV
jgi:hypothetical protein